MCIIFWTQIAFLLYERVYWVYWGRSLIPMLSRARPSNKDFGRSGPWLKVADWWLWAESDDTPLGPLDGWFRPHDSQIFLHNLTCHTMRSQSQEIRLCLVGRLGTDSRVRCSRIYTLYRSQFTHQQRSNNVSITMDSDFQYQVLWRRSSA
jgi:hypothetical protein